MKIIDLRSDTITQPTPEMRAAIAAAPLGDDVYSEDPTVNRLQELAAEMVGKEAALLVPTGTMGNLASIMAHCGRGDEVILGDLSHTYLSEAGGSAVLAGVHPRVVPNQPDGTLRLADIEAAINSDNPHFAVTRLISLENTHNRCMGAVLPLEYVHAVGDLARRRHLKLHLDGSRLFNAAIASGVRAAEIARPFDSLTFCLSKGLCAPVGSLVAGNREFVRRAHRARKILGGGMRQAGVLAAAGIVALETMVERLGDDHARARALASQLAGISNLVIENEIPESNMVYLALSEEVPWSGEQVKARLESQGVKVGQVASRRFRLVTHYWVSDESIARTAAAFRQAVGDGTALPVSSE